VNSTDVPGLVDQLRAVAKRTLAAAGPRYSPALDPDAPNLEIRSLQQAASALSLGSGLAERVKELGTSLRAAYDRDHYLADRLFARRSVNLQRLAIDLDHVAVGGTPSEVRQKMLQLRRHLKSVLHFPLPRHLEQVANLLTVLRVLACAQVEAQSP
jgi:hypothetical protein